MLKRTKRTLERLAVGTVLAGTVLVWPYKNMFSSKPVHVAVPGITHGYTRPAQKEYTTNKLLWYATGPSLALLLAWLYDKTKKRTTTPGEALAHKYSLGAICGTIAGLLVDQYAEEFRSYSYFPKTSRDCLFPGIAFNYVLNGILDQGEGSILRGIKNCTSAILGRTTHTAFSYKSEQGNTLREALHKRNLGHIEEALALERKALSDIDTVIDRITLGQEVCFPLSFFLGTLLQPPATPEQVYFWRAGLLARFGWFSFADKYIEKALATSKHPYIAFTIAEWLTSLNEQEETLKQWWPGPHKRFAAKKNLAQRAQEAWTEAGKRLEKAKELQQVRIISTAEKNMLVIDNPYLEESIVLAAPKTPEDQSCIDWEEKTLQWYYLLFGHLIPTPIGKIRLQEQTCFAERLIGKTTIEQAISQKTFDEQQKQQTIDLLAKIHNHTPPFAFNPAEKNPDYFKELLAKSLNNFLQHNPFLEGSIHRIVEELEPTYYKLKCQPFAFNKDTHPQNWTILNGIVRAIDFGCTQDGPRKGPVLNNLVRLVECEGMIQEDQKTTAKQLQKYLEKTHWQWNDEPAYYYAESGVYDHLLCAGNRMREYLATQNPEKLERAREHLLKTISHITNTRVLFSKEYSLVCACTNILQACGNN